jgi:hypothetical protein
MSIIWSGVFPAKDTSGKPSLKVRVMVRVGERISSYGSLQVRSCGVNSKLSFLTLFVDSVYPVAGTRHIAAVFLHQLLAHTGREFRPGWPIFPSINDLRRLHKGVFTEILYLVHCRFDTPLTWLVACCIFVIENHYHLGDDENYIRTISRDGFAREGYRLTPQLPDGAGRHAAGKTSDYSGHPWAG